MIRKMAWLLLTGAFIFSPAAMAAEHPALGAAPDDIRTWLEEAQALVSRKEYDEARNRFSKVLRIEPENEAALMGMAQIDFDRRSWGDAKDWYQKVLNLDDRDPAAHYGFAVCKREIGAGLVLLQRHFAWRSAEQHFDRVLAIDSTYRDVLLQKAVLERYREHYPAAVLLGHRQLAVHPDDPAIQKGLITLYDYLIQHMAEEAGGTWLESRSTSYDRYALAEWFRRKGYPSDAEARLAALPENLDPVLRQAVFLSQVRIDVETGRPREAEQTYWKAVDVLKRVGEGVLLTDNLKLIVNDEEYAWLQEVGSVGALKEGIRLFWRRRDPMPASAYNRRLVEHFRRVIKAEKDYRYDGFRHALSRADRVEQFPLPAWYFDNETFNDMGLIYIRYGEPDEEAVSARDDVPKNRSWYYGKRPGSPVMIFHFTIAPSAPNDYWTLTYGFYDPHILENLFNWDDRYYEMYSAIQKTTREFNPQNTELQQLGVHSQLMMDRREDVNTVFHTDRNTWSGDVTPLEMQYRLYRFREKEDRECLELAWEVPVSELTGNAAGDTILESGLAVFDAQMQPLKTLSRDFSRASLDSGYVHDGRFIDVFTVSLPQGNINVALHARIPGADRLNGWQFAYPLVREENEGLSLSSLMPAFSIEGKGASRDRRNLHVVPNPSARFSRSGTVYVYYEIYDLAFGEDGMTRYGVKFTLRETEGGGRVFEKLSGIFGSGDRYEVSLESEQSGESRTVTDYIGFDVSQARKGDYQLELEVTDHVTGKSSAARTELTLF